MPTSIQEEQDLLTTARQLPDQSERIDFLRSSCVGRPRLLANLERMLEALENNSDFLAPDSNPDLKLIANHEEMEGQEIGPYKLIKPLGEGGMGVVYLAEQSEPIRRQVALKIIKPGMDSRQVIARFQAERQTLAIMDHDNITKVYDAGTTPSGRAYFVMELIHGLPITRFCDEHNLSTTRRLQLFHSACEAIQHAHQKGIIHRDIKPNNVMVNETDGQYTVKVIDFGIARAIHDPEPHNSLLTTGGQMIGTLAYMSPEQANSERAAIDIRTDVYGLGALLYELLAGTPPFNPKRLKTASLDELRRIICEEDPCPPSQRPGEDSDSDSKGSRKWWRLWRRHQITSDLDWITLKSLSKERHRRYDSVNGLALDIQRYLNHEPVTAYPPSTVYRLGKLYRRHKTIMLSTAAIVCSLMIGVLTTTQESRKARQAARQERLAHYRARTAFENERAASVRAAQAETQERTQRRDHHLLEGQRLRSEYDLLNALEHFHKASELTSIETAPSLGDQWRLSAGFDETPTPVSGVQGINIPRLSPNGNEIAGMGGIATLVPPESVKLPKLAWKLQDARYVGEALYAISYNPDPKSCTLRSWRRLKPDGPLEQFGTEMKIRPIMGSLNFHLMPDGQKAIVLENNHSLQLPGDRSNSSRVRVIDLTTGLDVIEPTTHDFRIHRIWMHPVLPYFAYAKSHLHKADSIHVQVHSLDPAHPLAPAFNDSLMTRSIGFHPTEARLAIWKHSVLSIVDLTTGLTLASTPASDTEQFAPASLAFSADGKFLVSPISEQTAIWDTATLTLSQKLDTQYQNHHAVLVPDDSPEFSVDGSTLIMAVGGQTQLWNVESGMPASNLIPGTVVKSHQQQDRYLLTSMKGSTILWDRYPITSTPQPAAPPSENWVDASPNYRYLIANGSRPALLNRTTNQVTRLESPSRYDFPEDNDPISTLHTPPHLTMSAMNSQETVVACMRSPSRVQLWRTNGESLGEIKTQSNITHFALSPDGKTLAIASSLGVFVHRCQPLGQTGKKLLFPASPASEYSQYEDYDTGLPQEFEHVTFSHSGKMLAGKHALGVTTWNTESYETVWTCQLKPDTTGRVTTSRHSQPKPVTFSPNDKVVISATNRSFPILIDAFSGAHEIMTLRMNHHKAVFSDDANVCALIAPHMDAAVQVYFRKSDKTLTEPKIRVEMARDVDLSPDGQLLLTAHAGITIHEASTGNLVWKSNHLPGGNAYFRHCYFSNGGRTVNGIRIDGGSFTHDISTADATSAIEQLLALRSLNPKAILTGPKSTAANTPKSIQQISFTDSRTDFTEADWHQEQFEGNKSLFRLRTARHHLRMLRSMRPDDEQLKLEEESLMRLLPRGE